MKLKKEVIKILNDLDFLLGKNLERKVSVEYDIKSAEPLYVTVKFPIKGNKEIISVLGNKGWVLCGKEKVNDEDKYIIYQGMCYSFNKNELSKIK